MRIAKRVAVVSHLGPDGIGERHQLEHEQQRGHAKETEPEDPCTQGRGGCGRVESAKPKNRSIRQLLSP